MKCKNCGAELGLEDAYCRYCGAPNEFAQKHIKDMQTYQRSYEQTERSVHRTTKAFAGTAIRAVILSILIVVALSGVFLIRHTYSVDYVYRQFVRDKNHKAISATLDSYLADRDYLKFYGVCSYYGIHSYNDEGVYEKYNQMVRLTEIYQAVVDDLRRIATPSEYANQFIRYENLADDVNYMFAYEMAKPELIEGEGEMFVDMKENIKAALIAYADLTPEEAASLETLEDVERKKLIEGKYEGTVD